MKYNPLLNYLPNKSVCLTIVIILSIILLTASDTHAAHGSFNTSAGIYRIPYENGLIVTAFNDHHNHPSVPNRVDMGAGEGTQIVAAASGIIRGIVDFNGDDNDRGDGLGSDLSTEQDDDLEHSCLDSDLVIGNCSDYNNYVWIEHPNGEWTKYTHLQTGSVTIDNNWSVGDTIFVGDALGTEGDVGSASGPHLHHEIAAIPANASSPPFSTLGGFISSSWNVVAIVCFQDGDADNDSMYTDDEMYTAAACINTSPTANAGGPYAIDEGSSTMLDGTGSTDPHNAILIYAWSPANHLDDPHIATPVYSGLDDTVDNLTLTVSDVGGDVTDDLALIDDDTTTVTVLNVPPTVSATGDNIIEAGTATISALFTDPGTLDTHSAMINWGDGTTAQAVTVATLATGVNHIYGDNGVYDVTVTVTDDDGGEGTDQVTVTVANLDPTLTLNTTETISFPGGDYFIINAGNSLAASADGTDPGSDDLTFTWSVGGTNTYFNNGIAPDPAKSPNGTFPFVTSDAIGAIYVNPGVESLTLELTDDDNGSDSADATAIITGNAQDTKGSGWWKHQYSSNGMPHIDTVTTNAYLEIINAVSSVFSESRVAANASNVNSILSPKGGNRRARAEADLMVAWLQFASGAVNWDATVPLVDGSIAFLDLMFTAESTILDGTATNAELMAVEQALVKVRHAY